MNTTVGFRKDRAIGNATLEKLFEWAREDRQPNNCLDISQDRRSVQSRFSENTLAFASSRFEKGINKAA